MRIMERVLNIFRNQNDNSITHPAELAALLTLGTTETISGISITPKKAMAVPAFNRGVNLLSEMVAMLPVKLYRKISDSEREEARSHNQYGLFHTMANDYMTAGQFRYVSQRNLLLYGNAYAFKNKIRGVVRKLTPIHPPRVRVEQNDNLMITYVVTMPSGLERKYTADDIWHLRAHSEDGVVGISPVQEHRETLAMCIAAEQHGAMLFSNAAKPGGILHTDSKVSEEDIKKITDSWHSSVGGGNKYSTAVVDNGFKFSPLAMDNEHVQYIEIRQFLVAEIARILGIPPILLWHSDTASTFASAKELVQAFLKFSLDPWLTLWEENYNTQVISGTSDKFYSEFVRQGIERMDLSSRMESYAKAIQNRIMNPNEVRQRENMNGYDGGDEFLNPNITPGGQDDGQSAE